ncbi:hypothetical protein [Algoriphagus terrigena]|uniref:hypothetical protein n=1 Tax=Algoriphagus terrigena TaxID=344884 RepID=UPI000408003A|nr:hypothetical protein [Algoriphagus terrigena]
MPASAKRNAQKPTVFYLIIAAALIYNLFLLFASKGTQPANSSSENEFTTSTLTK